MPTSSKFRLSFAQRLLCALVAINLVTGVAIVLNTARSESAAIEASRIAQLQMAADLLEDSLSTAISGFGGARRSELHAIIDPIIHSNPGLDMMGMFLIQGTWAEQAWTREQGKGALKELLPTAVVQAMIASESDITRYENLYVIIRPIYQDKKNSGKTELVSHLVLGIDRSATNAELIPRVKKLGGQLGLLVVVQTLLVAVFLERKLRRPLARISNKTAVVEQENTELASEFSNLGDLARIEKATELLGQSRIEYKQKEAHLRTILANIRESVLVLDRNANILEVNQEFVSTWGYSPEEIVGQPVQKIMHPRHRTKFEKDIKKYQDTGVVEFADIMVKLEAVDMNGREFPINYIYSECIVGKERMFVVTVSDISEQQRQSEELIEAKDRAEWAQHHAEQAAAAKAAFLANMSHEIRTPMNGVMGLLDLVGYTELDAQQSALIKTAKVSAESLLNVLNDILDISKIEAGKVDLELTDFDIKSVFEEVVTLFHISANDKGLELSCFVDPRIKTYVQGDPTRLRQIVSNIVGNAVKFTPCGEVEVRLDLIEEKAGLLNLDISVRDTGIGMPEEAIVTLFDPFSQADQSTTRKFGGTGLGMAISRQLVELMDGTISATSTVGEGTTFSVKLGLASTDRPLVTRIDTSLLPPTRALIVDDSKTNRDILEAYLSNWNIDFCSVGSAKEALALLTSDQEKPFDICLLDYHMPEIDGIELARSIQEKNCAPSMVLALLSSGLTDTSLLDDVGIVHKLNKPIRQAELFELVAQCLNIALQEKAEDEVQEQAFVGHVLLVEDNKVNQLVAKSLLEKTGLTVDMAIDGVEALEAMASKEYDLVFMDCLMPTMDGYEATVKRRELEKEKNIAHVPIVALTANAMSGDREKCLNSGMDDFLTKPIKLDEMKEIIHYWLNEQKKNDPDHLDRVASQT